MHKEKQKALISSKKYGCSIKLVLIGMLFVIGIPCIIIVKKNLPYIIRRSNALDVALDFRNINRALNNYYNSNHSFPSKENLYSLTTPVAYYSLRDTRSDILFQDPFQSPENPFYTYHLYKGHNIYMLQSNGPDRDRDFTDYSLLQKENANDQEQMITILHQYRYDPTNGFFSNGDILNLPGFDFY